MLTYPEDPLEDFLVRRRRNELVQREFSVLLCALFIPADDPGQVEPQDVDLDRWPVEVVPVLLPLQLLLADDAHHFGQLKRDLPDVPGVVPVLKAVQPHEGLARRRTIHGVASPALREGLRLER